MPALTRELIPALPAGEGLVGGLGGDWFGFSVRSSVRSFVHSLCSHVRSFVPFLHSV